MECIIKSRLVKRMCTVEDRMNITGIYGFSKYMTEKLSKESKSVLYVIVSMTLHAATVLVIPLLSKYLIDTILPNYDNTKLIYVILAMSLLPFLQGFLMTFEDYSGNKIGHNVITKIRILFFKNHLRTKYEKLMMIDSGVILKQIINETEEVAHWIYITGIQVYLNFARIIIIIAFMAKMSWQITFISTISLGLYIIPIKLFEARTKEKSMREVSKSAEVVGKMKEGISAYYFMKANDNQQIFLDEYNKVANEYELVFLESLKQKLLNLVSSGVIKGASISLIYLVGGLLVLNGSLSIGELIASKFYIDALLICGKILNDRFMETVGKIPVVDRVNKCENDFSDLEVDGNEIFKNVKSIQLENLSHKYEKKEVFKNFNIEFEVGKTNVIVGKSGCGKSTLIHLLYRLYDPTAGDIYLSGNRISKYELESLRRKIKIVSQQPDIINGTIMDNLTFGINDVDQQFVRNIVNDLNLTELIESLPEKFDTYIGENYKTGLSGGEMQRIAVARTLISKPEILLLDEVTSALDNENIIQVISTIKKYMKNKTVISVTHNSKVVEMFEHVYYFTSNEKLLKGVHKELIKNSSMYQEHFQEITT